MPGRSRRSRLSEESRFRTGKFFAGLTMTQDDNQISARSAALAIGAALLTGLIILGVNFYPSRAASTEVPPPISVNTTDVDPQTLPESRYLEPGESAPAIAASQWIPGPPAAAKSLKGKYTVLDLWDTWCPFSRELSPGLIAMSDEYSTRNVEFVSLTIGKSSGKTARQRGWISGYAASDSLTSYQSLFDDLVNGVVVHPTIYLIGLDGRVIWCDNGMRENHAESAEVEASVRAALDAALDAAAATSVSPAQSN